MTCPFLKEGRAQYCHAAPLGKLILEGPGFSPEGRCTTADYFRCELVKSDTPLGTRCPHLEEIHVQYCGVNTPVKLIPFSESRLSGCSSGEYRYCESYLALAQPHGTVPAPANLLFSANHFWLDAEESGLCHLGLDSFFADVVGQVDGVTFVTAHHTQEPVVSLTIHGVEWPLKFPNAIRIEKVNSHVRGDPSRVTADPYGSGWLFSGWELPDQSKSGLLFGAPAAAWQDQERVRLLNEVQDLAAVACDGGHPVKGVGQLLSREQLVCLLQHHFSNGTWRPGEQS
jgi:glycine cleavage system H lipoate-binding protein